MKKKYLLSSGQSTGRLEEYIIDLFKLNLLIWPDDIPNSVIGFNFILSDTKKDEVMGVIRSRLNDLCGRLQTQLGVTITIESIEFLSDSRAKIKLSVGSLTDSFDLDLTQK